MYYERSTKILDNINDGAGRARDLLACSHSSLRARTRGPRAASPFDMKFSKAHFMVTRLDDCGPVGYPAGCAARNKYQWIIADLARCESKVVTGSLALCQRMEWR